MNRPQLGLLAGLLLCGAALLPGAAAQTAPPFAGTIFLDPDIITDADRTTFQSATSAGRGNRSMFDRRVNAFIVLNAYLINVRFDDGLTTEVQVNPEFGSADAALAEAQKYAPVIGRLPTVLRQHAQTVWIHKGTQPFGGGNNNLLIHTGQADLYIRDGILEETFVHEAAHTSLDAAHATASGWQAAQASDRAFISTYARDNPTREDVAESFLPYLAVRYRSGRITSDLAATITQTIPNRIAYFNSRALNMYPITGGVAVEAPGTLALAELGPSVPNPVRTATTLSYTLREAGPVRLSVYDVLGRVVAVLVSAVQGAGRFDATWEPSGVPDGVYLYRLDTGKQSLARTLVVARYTAPPR